MRALISENHDILNRMRLGSSNVSEDDLSQSLYELTIRSTNEVLESLYLVPYLHKSITLASQDQNWWYRRTEYLVKQNLIPRIGDWSRVYASLEKNGLTFNSSQDYGSTPLVQVLLEIGADPSKPEGEGTLKQNRRVMSVSLARSKNVEALNLLLNDLRVPSLQKDSILRASVDLNNIEFVRIILQDEKISPSAYDNTYIRSAARYGHKKIVELLLTLPPERGVDPSASENVAIINAIELGYIITARLLLADPRTDPSLDNNVVMRQAASIGDVDLVRYLLEDPRVDPSDADNEAIRDAAEFGFLDIVELLLTDPRVLDGERFGLEEAVRGNHLEVVRLLIRAIGDVDEDEILTIAVKIGNPDIVRLLLRDGTNQLQAPAVNIARIRGRNDLVEILLTHPDLRTIDERDRAAGRE